MSNLLRQVPEMDFDQKNVAENWIRWKEVMQLIFEGPDAAKWKDEQKAAQFLMCIGQKGRDMCRSWVSSGKMITDERKDPNKLFEHFEAYCSPRKNVSVQRKIFYERNQRENETTEEWMIQLSLIAENCAFDNTDDMLKDKLLTGTKSKVLQQKLLLEESLTLDKAMKIAQALEASQASLKAMEDREEVHGVYKGNKKRSKFYQGKKKERNDESRREETSQVIKECHKCGYKHLRKEACRAEGKPCYNCGKTGHFARMCRSKNNAKINECHKEELKECLFLGTINNGNGEKNEMCVNLSVGTENKIMQFKLDTGAQVNCIPKRLYEAALVRSASLKANREEKLSGYGGDNLKIIGTCTLKCAYKERSEDLNFYVIDTPAKPILGYEACISLGLVKITMSVGTEDSTTHAPEITTPQVLEDFKDVFDGLGHLAGKCHITLKEGANPKIHPVRKVPFALKDRIKKELEIMERMGVVVRVEEPTPWVNSMVAVEKKGSERLRICIDPRDLNQEIMREHYPLPTIEEISSKLANSKYFSKLDAKSGYWQIELDEPSSTLTTFNTPYGRWRFTRLPFGIVSAQEIFQKKIHLALEKLDGVEVIIDDILVHGATREEHDKNLLALLKRCQERNLKLNSEKITIGVQEVSFYGHKFTAQGLQPDPEKVEAIKQMAAPTSKKELETVMGMVNYLGRFSSQIAEKTAPLRQLLRKDSEWIWDENQNKAFADLKELITQEPGPVLQYFDPEKEVTVQVDASQYGTGAALLQEGRPVAYSSRSLTPTQRRYAQIEKEMLAIVVGCEKFHQYIYGRRVTVQTDHKPLENIAKKPLASCPPRIQRMLLRIQKYDAKVVYVPGKRIPVADTLSRFPEYNNMEEDDETLEEQVHTVWKNLPVSDTKIAEIQATTAKDETMKKLTDIINNGWPEKKSKVPQDVQEYWSVKEELSIVEGIVFRGENIVVPRELRPEILRQIHEGHFGTTLCKRRARDLLYWPGMSNQIQDMVSSCAVCQENQRSNQKEPMIPSNIPERPWQKVASDLFMWNNHEYLLVVDYYSRYFEIEKLSSTSASKVINGIKSIFARHGICDELVIDNGPQYTSTEFHEFSKTWNFHHTRSSPYHPQSNGLAEKYIQIAKGILKKADGDGRDPYLGLLSYRSTPIDGIGSPAQLLMARRLKTTFPSVPRQLQQEIVEPTKVQEKLRANRQKSKIMYDRSAKTLPSLQEGERVRMQTRNGLWKPAVVIGKFDTPRSYSIRTEEGGEYRRNRKHLAKTCSSQQTTTNNHENVEQENSKDQNSSSRKSTTKYSRFGRKLKPLYKEGFVYS